MVGRRSSVRATSAARTRASAAGVSKTLMRITAERSWLMAAAHVRSIIHPPCAISPGGSVLRYPSAAPRLGEREPDRANRRFLTEHLDQASRRDLDQTMRQL